MSKVLASRFHVAAHPDAFASIIDAVMQAWQLLRAADGVCSLSTMGHRSRNVAVSHAARAAAAIARGTMRNGVWRRGFGTRDAR